MVYISFPQLQVLFFLFVLVGPYHSLQGEKRGKKQSDVIIKSFQIYLNGKCTLICQFVEAGNNPEVILL